ncbi:MAG: hypothetical protein KKA73_31255 [Chloroflexi bacterium]|nr:hypothetical protein [Chloroflexota bacterium]MBU1752180.1 hypothetical protein [Chloroflexota bacterium]
MQTNGKVNVAVLWVIIIAAVALTGGVVVQFVDWTMSSSVLAVGLAMVLVVGLVEWWSQWRARRRQ